MREDRVGKLFVMLFTNGDLLTNPMRLRECLVCGEVFSRIDSPAHTESLCTPSPEQTLGRRVGVAVVYPTFHVIFAMWALTVRSTIPSGARLPCWNIPSPAFLGLPSHDQ
jgi:hypothetical protein